MKQFDCNQMLAARYILIPSIFDFWNGEILGQLQTKMMEAFGRNGKWRFIRTCSENGKSWKIQSDLLLYPSSHPQNLRVSSRLKKAMTHICSHWICPKGNKYNINCYNQSSRSEIFMIRFSEDDPEDPFELEFLKTF